MRLALACVFGSVAVLPKAMVPALVIGRIETNAAPMQHSSGMAHRIGANMKGACLLHSSLPPMPAKRAPCHGFGPTCHFRISLFSEGAAGDSSPAWTRVPRTTTLASQTLHVR